MHPISSTDDHYFSKARAVGNTPNCMKLELPSVALMIVCQWICHFQSSSFLFRLIATGEVEMKATNEEVVWVLTYIGMDKS